MGSYQKASAKDTLITKLNIIRRIPIYPDAVRTRYATGGPNRTYLLYDIGGVAEDSRGALCFPSWEDKEKEVCRWIKMLASIVGPNEEVNLGGQVDAESTGES